MPCLYQRFALLLIYTEISDEKSLALTIPLEGWFLVFLFSRETWINDAIYQCLVPIFVEKATAALAGNISRDRHCFKVIHGIVFLLFEADHGVPGADRPICADLHDGRLRGDEDTIGVACFHCAVKVAPIAYHHGLINGVLPPSCGVQLVLRDRLGRFGADWCCCGRFVTLLN